MSRGYIVSGCMSKAAFSQEEAADRREQWARNALFPYTCLCCGQVHVSRKKRVRK